MWWTLSLSSNLIFSFSVIFLPCKENDTTISPPLSFDEEGIISSGCLLAGGLCEFAG